MESTLQKVIFAVPRTRFLHLQAARCCAASKTQSVPHTLRLYSSAAGVASRTRTLPTIQTLSQAKSFHTSRKLHSKAVPGFSFGIAAGFVAKDKRFIPRKHIFDFNPYDTVHQRPAEKRLRHASGQDAFFASTIGGSKDVAFGVADGVGGWMDSGVDPADFSHGFCNYMAYAANTHNTDLTEPLSAQSLMQKGYDGVLKDASITAGGSTACVALAKQDGSLEVANLGDSGFIQLRLNAVTARSPFQTHAFNTPYQLSKLEQKEFEKSNIFGRMQIRDYPKDANITQHSVRHGDVLVFASDGVWDNLTVQEILGCISRQMLSMESWVHTWEGIKVGSSLHKHVFDHLAAGEDKCPPSLQGLLATAIVREAQAASLNTRRDGPFAKEMRRYYPHESWSGGKVDDICVVVAVVVEEESV